MTDASAQDFLTQEAEQQLGRSIRASWLRLTFGTVASLGVIVFAVQGGIDGTILCVLLWIAALLCLSGYTPRVFRWPNAIRPQPTTMGARNAFPETADTIRQTAGLRRQLHVTQILRGLVLVALIVPLPVLKIMNQRAHFERYGTTGAVVIQYDAQGNKHISPLERQSVEGDAIQPDYIGPVPWYDRLFSRRTSIPPEAE